MKRKKEVSYFIKIDKDEKKITVLAENEEILLMKLFRRSDKFFSNISN